MFFFEKWWWFTVVKRKKSPKKQIQVEESSEWKYQMSKNSPPRESLDPPMEGWMNLFVAGVYSIGPQNGHLFLGWQIIFQSLGVNYKMKAVDSFRHQPRPSSWWSSSSLAPWPTRPGNNETTRRKKRQPGDLGKLFWAPFFQMPGAGSKKITQTFSRQLSKLL